MYNSDEDDDSGSRLRPPQRMHNQPYDEAFDVDDPDEIASHLAASPMPPRRSSGRKARDQMGDSDLQGNTPPSSVSGDESSDDYGGELGRPPAPLAGQADSQSELSGSESMSSSEEDGSHEGPRMEGGYDPAVYEDLQVSSEVKELFSWISRYTPQVHDLDTKLQPFIPDYIPAVGDIDAFIKIPRPDRKETELGLEVLDEPCAAQSDGTVLDLHLRTISKTAPSKGVAVKSVPDAENHTKAIESWVSSITELHRQKPPQNVHYSAPMPDIEDLMQEWPEQFEKILTATDVPSAELDVTLKEYVEIACGMLDIPVHHGSAGHTQALHVLFSLFIEFKNSQHFKQQQQQAPPEDAAETLTLDDP
eukprot:m.23809 g.23809  ORF g.23809 m.23809 type:complete len:363 (+) comp7301_c0_seq1:251-1339(+)